MTCPEIHIHVLHDAKINPLTPLKIFTENLTNLLDYLKLNQLKLTVLNYLLL